MAGKTKPHQEKQDVISAMLLQFCNKHLDQEYADLSEKLLQKLGRKRVVPFMTGKPEIWAAAIIHALGTINFLFDKSAEPFSTVDEISAFFGTSKSTVTGKSKLIRDMFKLNHWDSEFSTAKLIAGNPFAQLKMVNGFIIPKSW